MKNVETTPAHISKKPPPNFPLSQEDIAKFCRKWQITELALFGSILRDDFTSQSDLDVLVTFAPLTRPSLFDLIQIRDELARLSGRKVDVLTKKSVEQSHNWLRKKNILDTARVIYAL